MTDKPKILTVDDRPQNLLLLDRLLKRLDIQVCQATSGREALSLALENDFFLAIVDIQMPEMDGYELVELLRGNDKTASLPVIFVSAIFSDEYHHRKAYDSGAVDFMSKPFIAEILVSKVKIFLELYNKRRGLEELVLQLDENNVLLSKRAIQLETGGQVGRQITSILKLGDLLPQVTSLIQERFGYYFVGAWLLNQDKTVLELKASSQVGDHIPEGYILKVDNPQSIVAYSFRNGYMYLANDVHVDRNYLQSEQLPGTRAELALPLKFGAELLGVLDIESNQTDAFAADDVTALQSVADQVAIAIRNASLYSQVVGFNEYLEEVVSQRTAELQKAYKTLEQMDKNKSDFIAVAAHELRTPLTLIRGYTEMIKSMAAPELQPMVEGVLTGEGRLLEVVNSMLDISKIDNETLRATREMVSLRLIIDEVGATYASDLEDRSLSLALNGLGKLPLIQADPDLMRKLFKQLLVNAIKYTPDGGRITVNGQILEQAGDQGSDQFVQISITDTGIGIAPDQQELIFEKFYQTGKVQLHSSGRTKFKGGGPGLGLAIARGIVNVHRGRIWVESSGHDEKLLPGSTFHVLLPVKAQ